MLPMGQRIASICSVLVGLLAAPIWLVLSFCWWWIERFIQRGAWTAAMLYGVVVYVLVASLGVQAIRCLLLAPALWRGRIVYTRAASIRRHTTIATALVGVIGIVLPFIVYFPGREWMIFEYWLFVTLPALVVGAAVFLLSAALASQAPR